MPRAGSRELLVRTSYAGINASDINWTAGRYLPGLQPPFDTGFEGLGKVVEVGKDCKGFQTGDSVLFMHAGSFSEYLTLPYRKATLLPRLDPAYLSLLVSGCTASIALEKFAVQLAKLAGCHVIGTCSTDEKADFLRGLGCDRPINYKKENLKSVLREEYPRGVDVMYEGIGGEIFNTCVKNLATKGKLVVIGFIESYKSSNFSTRPTLPLHQILLSKSASIRGFFLNDYVADLPSHISRLCQLYEQGQLKALVDVGEGAPGGPFRGLESVYDAVDHLFSGCNRGKVVVEISPPQATPESATRAKL
ncbi:Prostaglandin reductase-3 [Geodia barretti]|uniref:15-oxoprostaglandin 13-reductase n=1 Tax=Geodia barretti TaxID=519541 RepID=A0AA35WHZ5_GEOBA|nr:Prostaglandin reductase-3 [Geodia barretti]